jgi:hypothetical protein
MVGKMPRRKDAKPDYQPTERELAAIERVRKRRRAAQLKVADEDARVISPDHPDKALGSALLLQALGTLNWDFATGLIDQLANAGSKGRRVDERALNFMLSVIDEAEPRDQFEAMLGPDGSGSYAGHDLC